MLQDINLGTVPGDKTGDPAHIGGQKINANFHYLENKINFVNALIYSAGFTLVGQDLTMTTGWQWKINNIDYSNPANVVINIPYAAAGKQRIDVIVMNTSNTFQRIPGVESTATPVQPSIPANTLQATIVVVGDAVVGAPSEPVLGANFIEKAEKSAFVLDSGGVIGIVGMVGKQRRLVLKGAITQLSGVTFSDTAYDGQEFMVDVFQAGDVLIKHNNVAAGTGYKFFFYNGLDFTAKGKSKQVFKFNAASGFLEYVGIIIASSVEDVEQRIPVNNANYTITETDNQLIAFTALTADRSLFLPPATNPNQRIRIADESFTCSGTRRIVIVPNGTDVISGGINSVINFPGGSAYLESNGSGKWMILSTTAIQLSAGVNTLPSITDNANGTVTIGSGVYTLFANTDGSGRPKSYSISGGTYTMVDGSLNYIIAKYDPVTSATSLINSVVESDINSLSSTKVFSIYRQGTVLFIRDNDRLGLALSNKLQRNAEQTNNIRVNSGTLLLSESATRIVNVSAGTAWIGGNEIILSTVASSTANTMFFVTQTSPGVWDTSTFAPSGQYNNTQYNPASGGLSTLSNGRYGVIFVFRSLGQGNKLAYVLGQGNYTLGEAQQSTRPTNLPLVITSQMIPVGRIIIQKNASTATQIDKISDESYAFSGVTDHEALSNLLGGDSGGHFHVTQAEKDLWNGGARHKTIYFDNIAKTPFTGTTAQSISWSFDVPANTIPDKCMLRVTFRYSKSGTGGITTYISDNASVASNGNKMIQAYGTSGNGTAVSFAPIRHISVNRQNSNEWRTVATSGNFPTDFSGGTLATSSYDNTVSTTFYIWNQLSVSTDIVNFEFLTVEAIY